MYILDTDHLSFIQRKNQAGQRILHTVTKSLSSPWHNGSENCCDRDFTPSNSSDPQYLRF